jgi:nucleoside-diphosphate-sugar epimerase
MPEPTVRGRRVLVTGSAGVIGRELLRRLDAAGAHVLSVDREALPEHEGHRVEHLRLDLADAPLAALGDFEPEFIVHLAAAFERSVETPGFWAPNWHDNVLPSHRIAALAAGIRATRVLVFASSYLVYRPELYQFAEPRQAAVALREDDAVAPRNLCGAAKLYAEHELDFVRDQLRPDLRLVHARIFRSYGRGSRDVISRWTRAALAREPVEIFGEANRFAYVFAGDVAEGLLRLAESPRASGPVNLAFGGSRTVREVWAAVVKRLPEAGALVRRGIERGPYEASGADLTRLRAWTGWEPGIDLDEGIGRIVEYERTVGGA